MRFEAITDPGLSEDVTGRGSIGLELFAQLADKYAQVFDLLGAMTSPDRSQQGTMSDDLSRMAGEIDQQIELLGGEMDLASPDSYLVGRQINAKVPQLNQ